MIPLAVFAPPKKPPAPPADMAGCCDQRVADMHRHAHGIIRDKGKSIADGALDSHVVAMMSTVKALLPGEVVATPVDRLKNNAAAADHSIPLAHLVR